MAAYRNALPQLSGDVFLADGGIETDLIFNHGIDIPEFAAHTLLSSPAGKHALEGYFRDYLSLARQAGTGFILDSQTWKAHPHWASDLGVSKDALEEANHQSLAFIAGLREEFSPCEHAIVLNAVVGPRGDGYIPDCKISAQEAERYHSTQMSWLAGTEADMVTATTFTRAQEAIGLVRAARKAGLPVVVSFTLETDGRLPDGQPLSRAIETVDRETDCAAAYFMINCAHPDHFSHVLEPSDWARRIRGIRCNASRKSHAELDQSDSLDAGDPGELAQQYLAIREIMPWLNVFGSCCGTDLRHVTQIVKALIR